MDPLSRRQFWRLIDTLSADGITVLVTTHYLDEAERCHRVALINGGRLAVIGTVAEVKQIFASRPIVELRVDRPVDAMQLLDAMEGVEKTSLFGTALHAVLRNGNVSVDDVARELTGAGINIDSIEPVQPSLEDVFLDVVDKAGNAA